MKRRERREGEEGEEEEEEERKRQEEENLIPSRRTERPSVMVWDGAGRGWREQSRPVRECCRSFEVLDFWLQLD